MYRLRDKCRCINMCISAQECIRKIKMYFNRKGELPVNIHFNMIMKAGIAHYFFCCGDNESA